MKTRKPSGKKSRSTAAPVNEYPHNEGSLALIYDGIPGGIHDERESGSMVDLSTSMSVFKLIQIAQRWACCHGGKILNINTTKQERIARTLVFAPFDYEDWRFLQAAGSEVDGSTLTMKEAVRAHQGVTWITTKLRGADLSGMIRRAIYATHPNAVLVWPLGYYFGAENWETARQLLCDSEFGLPKSCQTPLAGLQPQRTDEDDDDSGEEWKRQ